VPVQNAALFSSPLVHLVGCANRFNKSKIALGQSRFAASRYPSDGGCRNAFRKRVTGIRQGSQGRPGAAGHRASGCSYEHEVMAAHAPPFRSATSGNLDPCFRATPGLVDQAGTECICSAACNAHFLPEAVRCNVSSMFPSPATEQSVCPKEMQARGRVPVPGRACRYPTGKASIDCSCSSRPEVDDDKASPGCIFTPCAAQINLR